jgi:hypothetical protein
MDAVQGVQLRLQRLGGDEVTQMERPMILSMIELVD